MSLTSNPADTLPLAHGWEYSDLTSNNGLRMSGSATFSPVRSLAPSALRSTTRGHQM